MLLPTLAVIVGLACLVFSADWFVDGAASAAKHWGMSPLLIGMLILGFGTSAPEMVVSAFAALQGNPALALGNGFGSNVANIGLVLGVSALIGYVSIRSDVVKSELPLLLAATLLVGFLVLDAHISRVEGGILLAAFAGIMGWSIYRGLQVSKDPLEDEVSEELEEVLPMKKAAFFLFAGLIILVASSRLLVWGAVDIAQAWGVSDMLIGLTVVAIGTSLPELAASVAAVRKGEHELVVGNIVGSNLFNTLMVVGIAAVITPINPSLASVWVDWGVMAAFTLFLLVMGIGVLGRKGFGKLEGILLLAGYVAYLVYLVA